VRLILRTISPHAVEKPPQERFLEAHALAHVDRFDFNHRITKERFAPLRRITKASAAGVF
jgi:hypothetical protein